MDITITLNHIQTYKTIDCPILDTNKQNKKKPKLVFLASHRKLEELNKVVKQAPHFLKLFSETNSIK